MTPGGVAEALHRCVSPAAILLPGPDVNLAVGARVAAHLYGTRCRYWPWTPSLFNALRSGMTVDTDGARRITAGD